jgi:NAD(P)-dependent dehydrogenase (short-subunit alcohol dehydrogenase family)
MQRLQGFQDKVAVVTGAASGMGRSLALQLAVEGARLAISDVDALGLAATATQARTLGAQVHEQRLDVADRDAVLAYADAVVTEYGAVHLVINNAGIALSGDVEDMSFADVERIMNVDFWGVVNGTMAFLPHLIASGDGCLVNTSSLFGLVAMPGQSAYNAAKFAVRGFTEALRQEMVINKHPVTVTCVHPGGIKTNIVNNSTAVGDRDVAALAALFDRWLARTSSDKAAEVILNGARKGKPRVLVGGDAKALDVLQRLTGSGYQRLFTAVAPRLDKKVKGAPKPLVRAS